MSGCGLGEDLWRLAEAGCSSRCLGQAVVLQQVPRLWSRERVAGCGGALPTLNAEPLKNRPKSKKMRADGELPSTPCS